MKVHYRDGEDHVLCKQDVQQARYGETTLEHTCNKKLVTCKNCLKLLPPTALKVEVSPHFGEAITKMVEQLKAVPIISANSVRKMMGLEPVCGACGDPILMMVAKGTGFCCRNCAEGKPK